MNRQRKKESYLILFALALAQNLHFVTSKCSTGEYYDSSTCVSCPAGYSCDSQSSIPQPCSAGSYSPEGTTTCLACSAGSYCPTATSSSQIPCSSGYYSGQCVPCPSGNSCTSTIVTSCSSGYYSLGQATSCTQCQAGYQCPSISHEPLICPTGYYSLVGAMQFNYINTFSSCIMCPAGSHCATNDATPITCNDGQYSLEKSLVCIDCPAGFSCSNKFSLPVACSSGTYSNIGQQACTTCPAGSQCPDKSDSSTVSACVSGKYSLASSAQCLDCPAGYQCSNPAIAPVACSSGYYSLSGSTLGCQQSSAGYACVSQKEEPVQCPLGYYSNAGDVTCTLCPAGSYCLNQQKITCKTQGSTCIAGSTSQDICPDGYGCDSPSTIPSICLSGYYSDPTTKQCTICQAGYSCSDRISHASVNLGYYSPSGESESYICPAGYKCLDSTLGTSFTKTLCLDGQYSNEGDGICTDCPIGYACPSKESSQKKIDCSKIAGYYSDVIKLNQCKICPSGYYCPTTQADKQACPSGTYSLEGSQQCNTCPPGYKCPNTNSAVIQPCTLGYYSQGGQSECTICPAGYSCSNMKKVICPDYQTSKQGEGFCSYYQGENYGSTILNEIVTYLECDSGQFKLFGTLGCLDCPLGNHCPAKNSTPVKCYPGTYQDEEKQTTCKSCPTTIGDSDKILIHYSSFGEYSCHICPAGFYCSNATVMPKQCQLGFYSESGQSECQVCTDGHICRFQEKLPNPEYSLCPAGFYCKSDLANDGRFLQKACPAGTYQPLRGQSSVSTCLSCPIGFYCPAGSEQPRNCTPGSYCVLETQHNQVYKCPGGSFSVVFMGTSTSVCQDCPEGYYCPEGSVQPVKCPTGYYCESNQQSGGQNPCPSGTYSGPFSISTLSQCLTCPVGFYCPTASTLPSACPTGTYNPSTSQKALTNCLNCPARKPCPYYGKATYELGIYCAHGHYCPSGTSFPDQYPCPAGKFSDDINITTSSQCTACPAKFACYQASNTLTRPKVPCAPGYYCPEGTQYPNQYPCSAGTYSPFTDNYQIAECIVCLAGYYCLEGSATPSGLCSPGYYCPQGSKNSTSQPCPSGTYQPYDQARSFGECQICPLGSYCLSATAQPILCPAGTFGNFAGLTSATNTSTQWGCTLCYAGYYCPTTGLIDPLTCGEGYYSDVGSLSCIVCPFDHYCANITTTLTEMTSSKCPYGFICQIGTTKYPYNPDYSCPAGYYCQDSVPYACQPGTYNPVIGAANSSFCMITPAGYFTSTEKALDYKNNICPRGYYCPIGSTNGISYQCPYGSYRNILGATKADDCGQCPTGHYCPIESVQSFICPIGYYCPQGSVNATPCAIGTFGTSLGLRESSDCTPCYAGRYCSQEGLNLPDGLCDPGYYCIQYAYTATPTDGVTGNICPAGGYCGLGSKKPSNCPPGKYNPSTGKSDSSSCENCTAGYYCSGSNNPTPTGKCYAGYFCDEGSQFPNQNTAPEGTFTLLGASAPTNCSAGSYNPYPAQSSCQGCPQGYVCPYTAMQTLIECYVGGFCSGNNSAPTVCLAGTYNSLSNGKSLTDCKACPAGQYCASTNLSASTGSCSAGYYCLYGAVSGSSDIDVSGQYGPCPKGSYCPPSTGAPMPCPSGTYGATTKLNSASQCTQCTAGNYCQSGGLTDPEGDCAPGYYCPTGSKIPRPNLTYCRAGQYCPSGSADFLTCPNGTYQNQIKQEYCLDCPKGYFCPSGTTDYTLNVCPIGYYCPANTSNATSNACKIGSYNNFTKGISENDCIPCDPGQTCASAVAQTSLLQPCQAGQYCILGAPYQYTGSTSLLKYPNYGGTCAISYYCPLGSAFQIPCPSGYYCATINLSNHTGKCNAGYYCIGGASKPNPTSLTLDKGEICPAGTYCPSGSSYPLPCPAGTYNTLPGQSDVSLCISCQAGYYCKNSTQVTSSTQCPAGYYCPGGSRTGTENICPIGSKCIMGSISPTSCSGISEYQDEQGAATCKTCQPGYYCSDSKITKCQPQKEVISYFCTGSIKTNQSCPAGTFNNKEGTSSVSDCKPCPPGFFCPNNITYGKKIIQCPAGYYCLQGTAFFVAFCPIGYYCPAGTNAPIPCPAGQYCETEGLTKSTGSCIAGYYCQYETFDVSALQGGINMCADIVMNQTNKLCVRGSIQANQTLCPQGSFCPLNSSIYTQCPIGTYSNKTGLTSIENCTSCEKGKYCRHRGLNETESDCQAGFFCPVGQSSDSPSSHQCLEGNYCPQGIAAQIPCTPGTYQPFKMQASCLQCPESFYCPDSGMSVPDICPAGKYCSQSCIIPQPCPAGYYSDLTGLHLVSQCQLCENGYYCNSEGATSNTGYCEAGYYCYANNTNIITSSTPQSMVCPKGSYCPVNSIIPTKCSPGTYNLLESQISVSSCLSCPAGQICPMYGLSDVSQFVPCPLGFYCTGGASSNSSLGTSVFICPPGYYCNLTISESFIECPIGTYNSMSGQYICKACLEGFVCENIATIIPVDCPAGYYCTIGNLTSSLSNKIKCPAGTFNTLNNLKSASECQICPKGKYCLEGETKSTGTGVCNAGYLCDNGAKNQSDTSKKCPAGHYCLQGALSPTACSAGTYLESEGGFEESNCQPCPAGTYTDKIGSVQCRQCAEGFVCFKNANTSKPTDQTTGRLCNIGNYCTSGFEYICGQFQYQNIIGQSSCETCPIGYNCNTIIKTDPVLCESGYFCNKGYQELCPNGTYALSTMKGLESPDQCIPCPTGYYCINGQLDTQKQACFVGHFCRSKAFSPNDNTTFCPSGFYCDSIPTLMPIKCPNGTYSQPGAANLSDCTACDAGYYCMDGSSQKFDCPEGSYCPVGTGNPIPCPKGFFGGYLNLKSQSDCGTCPSGALCNMTGIVDPNDYLCPPGYYCVRGALEAITCPAGYYRPVRGGSSLSSCTKCDGGFYCANEATVVPLVCQNGTYCPKGSLSPLGCPAGYYCPTKTEKPVICPSGFYCPGRIEYYFKCSNGSYCPTGTSKPIQCPGGTYGSGTSENLNQTISCDTCGRGQYSTKEQLGLCLDCTPGYVCLGSTNTDKPISIDQNNGYICPSGYYCPLASYLETACPIATYNKYQGRSQISDCLPCKANYYNDLIAQSGCKQCGPSSNSESGSNTCTCIGKHRNFIKSIGGCLCETGFKPKDGKKDADSVIDCEAMSKASCADGVEIDLEGNCVVSESKICSGQCQSTNGTIIGGTGLCSCSQIVEPDQICNAACRLNQIQVTLSIDGNMTIYDPKTNKTTSVDPSTINGYIGDYKCQSVNSSDCKVYSVGKSVSGDFTYDYSTDTNLLNKAGITTTSRRMLQSTTQTTITNPVMCIIQGNALLFYINSYLKQYPVYYKDSILNTNKNFDYGPFLELQSTINKGTIINSFSYIFKDSGIYVFIDSNDQSKYTIIGVVGSNQECSNKDANVQMTTAASLASIGIVSKSKTVNPNWSFIIGVFVFVILFAFGIVTFIIVMHNHNSAQNLKSSNSNKKKTTIYYDRINDMEQDEQRKSKWYYCLCKKFNDLANRAAKVQPLDDADLSYNDLANLLAEFKESMEVLKNKMKEDSEKAGDIEPQPEPELSEEDLLIQELNQLRKFVFDNKECIEDFFGIHRDKNHDQDDGEDLNDSRDMKDVDDGNNEMANLLRDQQNQEQKTMAKLKAGISKLKDQLMLQIKDKSDDEKQRMLDDFKNRIESNNLSDQEKLELLEEMEHRLNKVNDIMQSEESSQDKKLQDALAKRRQKKQELTKVMITLNNNKLDDNQHFNDQMEKIAQKEIDEIEQMEKEVDIEKRKLVREIDMDLKKTRSEKLADMEKKLEQMKKKKDNFSKNKDQEADFGDILNDYGKLVKKVEEELEKSKASQLSELEEKIQKRKDEKKKAIQSLRREREEKFNHDLNNKNKNLGDQIEQVKQLLKPVVNEDSRIQAFLDSEDIIKPIDRGINDSDYTSNKNNIAPYKKQLELVSEEEDQKIERLMDDIRKQADRQMKDHELQKSTILKKIEGTLDEKERRRLLEQYEKLKKNIDEMQEREIEEQNDNLREALKSRKSRKQKINEQVQQIQQNDVLKQVDDSTKQIIDKNLDNVTEQDVKNLTDKLSSKFEQDELVQVAENFLDQKHLRELQEYMLALFEERAKGLRKYIFDLMTQKQTELELIKEEFKPQYDFLKERRAKGQITDQQYKELMSKIQEEESDRRMDTEIHLQELEQKMEEDLMIQSVKNRAEVEQAFNDKQADEKIKMIDFLIGKNQGNDAIKQYLEKEKKSTLKELIEFKKSKDLEKQKKLSDIEQMKVNRQNELKEKEERMLNWEDRMKQEEAKHTHAFEKQKNAIMSKRLNEQKSELLREVNKDEINKLLASHKRDIANLETALQKEQERQMENMRQNVGEKLKEQESGKIKREIKMAQLIKDKDLRQKDMMNVSMASSNAKFGNKTESKEEIMQMNIEKVRLMQKFIDKKCYSSKIYVKEYHIKKVELVKKLLKKGEDSIQQAFMESGSNNNNMQSIMRLQSQMSDDSLMQDSVSSFAVGNLTFKELIDHVDRIENNYHVISKNLKQQ